MSNFYLNSLAQENGYHEIHKEDCAKLLDKGNRIPLGNFDFCSDAFIVAKEKYQIFKLKGCFFCTRGCYKK